MLPLETSSGCTFDMSAAETDNNPSQVTGVKCVCRLTVTIIGARNLKQKVLGRDVKDPEFRLKTEKESRRSRKIKSGTDEHGGLKVNQTFTFDVKDIKKAILSVHVYGKGLFGQKAFVGRCTNFYVENLLQEEKDVGGENLEARWYDLYSKDGSELSPGQVQMHIVARMAELEQKIHAFVGTWNVGNARPAKELSSWLPKTSFYDIVAVGAQECDYQPQEANVECAKDWMETLKSHLGSHYKVVHGISRGQIRLAIFVHEDAERAISQVESGTEATGVGHVMANKGGICISFKFWDTGLCFVNCHFAAHIGQCEARNSNFREIIGQLRIGMQNMDILNQFQHVFLLGDLNYRLDFGAKEENSLTPQTIFWTKVVKQIEDGDFKSLLQFDELSKEKGAGRTLHGFNEGEIKFTPTFKMQRGTIGSYDQKRMPAWCDRVLWRSLPGCDTQLLSYTCSQDISTSDHKPVAATFSFTTYAHPCISCSSLDDNKMWHVQFSFLCAKNLRAADVSGSSDPYVSFVGPNLYQESQTKVKSQTLHPTWDSPQELPTLVLNMMPLERLEKEHLLVRVLDYDYTSADDTLGYTVIPLAPAVTAFNKGNSAEFNVEISYHGLAAGTLEGVMKLTWERNATKREVKLANMVKAKTLSLRGSMKKVLSRRML